MKTKPLTEYWCSLNKTLPPPVPPAVTELPISLTDRDVSNDSDVILIPPENAEESDIEFLSETIALPKRAKSLENSPPSKTLSLSPLKKSCSTPPVSQHTKDLYNLVRSPTFLANYDKTEEHDANNLQTTGPIRKKEERKLLHGFDCKCCAKYYEALGLASTERQKRIDQVSRHRHVEVVPTTPDHYWEVKMAGHEEQVRRGQIEVTSSPVGLRPRNPVYATKSLRRKLFNT